LQGRLRVPRTSRPKKPPVQVSFSGRAVIDVGTLGIREVAPDPAISVVLGSSLMTFAGESSHWGQKP
jgi:hypothetical protein